MRSLRSIKIITLILVAVVVLSCSPRIASSSQSPVMSFDPRGLITVGDPAIQARLKVILSDNTDIRTDFRRIQDWVASYVVYDPNTSTYWQSPSETIYKKTGDCKDYSTLLCSLWRADGVPASDVYVAIGQSRDSKLHAFLIERYLNGKWQVIEPQVGGFITSDLGAIDTAEKYAITFLFNDVEYVSDTASINQIIRSSSTVAASPPAQAKKPLPVVKSFTADPPRIYLGKYTTLSWVVDGANYVGIDQGVGHVDPVGTSVVSPRDSTLYKLVASNSGGSITENLTVTVIDLDTMQNSQPALVMQQDVQPPFSIGFAGWYREDAPASTVDVGQQVSAIINLKGGSPGQCIVRIWRSIETGHDEVAAQWGFKYDGVEGSGQISFAPSYAVGESGTQGYYLDLMKDGAQVWTMPDGYPPRLTVAPRPGYGELSVGFAGWRTGTDNVYTAKKGEPVATAITLSGGDSGQYTLNVRRDTTGLMDDAIQQLTFYYDGSSAVQGLMFIPPYATGESSTRGYYLDLYKEGKFIWSLGGPYPPRLAVTK
ncbi:MAG: transglutaminase-like domain-containing protein [Dehalococcoidia bacterium]